MELRLPLGFLRRRLHPLLPLLEHLKEFIFTWQGPQISGFSPPEGRAGCLIDIDGAKFSENREANGVVVGGQPAFVVAATSSRLSVLTDPQTVDGPVEVTVAGKTAVSTTNFRVLPYPGENEDGPPIAFQGAGEGQPGDLSPTGTSRVLVALVYPSDRVPANEATARQAVADNWESVRRFYEEASFSTKDLQPDMPVAWTKLTGATNDYCDLAPPVENIKQTALDRLYAEAAKACQDTGFNLNNYGIFAVTLFLDGAFIRAWGGGSTQNFKYDPGPGGTKIDITLNQSINLLAVGESADWGRLAHEVGHNFVSAPSQLPQTETQYGPLVFGEDVYDSDLVDPNAATARYFDMMGDHDEHPLFSAYNMEKLGWYRPDNPAHDGDVLNITWDRNEFSQEFEIVAHGGVRNNVAGRYHAVKIIVAAGLFYYLEVRQRPGTHIFDDSIPVDTAPQQGGLVVTKVMTDTVNNNQQARFITLLHDEIVLKKNDAAIDPARDLTITVVDDAVINRPLVCRVRVAWAQGIADDPNGAFDLNLTPWDGTFTTPDIWVDRNPLGTFDKPKDPAGRPTLNGDKPKPGEINKIMARINCSGTVGATSAKVTFYSVEPPGVGDNGNWAPLVTKTVASIPANGFFDVPADWVPLVDRHTCLKVYASQQLGEVSGGNNSAQENVFEFEAPAFSPPAPVLMPVAVRNPRDEATVASIRITQVPLGYRVYFPHAWVHLDGHQERQFQLVVVPMWDVSEYVEKREAPPTAPVLVSGLLPRHYQEDLSSGDRPGSTFSPMGGILARVTPKRGTAIELNEDESEKTEVAVSGWVAHAGDGERLRVTLKRDPDLDLVIETFTDISGHFRASWDLLAVDGIEDISGTYTIQAFSFAADTVAEAESNVVAITR